MELILTHEHTDFDAVASMLAAHKLYPEAVPVLPRRLNRNVRNFLTLYRDAFPFVRPEDLTRRRVTRVILVDSQSFQPPKGIGKDTRVLVIDHHAPAPDLPANWTYCGDVVGATTTLLVEQIANQGISLTSFEATLLALGIYEDTGALLYGTTTPRDVRAVAWLLERGANLEVVERFLHHPLSPEQQVLFHQLVESAVTLNVHGHSIVIAAVDAPAFMDEISTLAHKLRDLYEPAGLFLLVRLDGRVQLVARSTTDAIDVGAVAAALGGGGHARAAAAVIRDLSLEQARQRLSELLYEHVRPSVTVDQIMSHGVRTLAANTSVREADEQMRRYGFEGFPVVEPETRELVGIVTRRQVDRALHHGLSKVPVSRIMYAGRFTVRPEDSVETLQQVMITSGWGQVPVVDGTGRIIGIVTRTDLIKLWGRGVPPSRKEEIALKLEEALPAALVALLKLVGQEAATLHMPLYAVGGFVRDLLLGEKNWDVDLVVEGDAIRLARQLARKYGGRVRFHKRFGTAKWILPEQGFVIQGEGLSETLDLVTARTEFYEHPTALPTVERSSIKQDLHRRDFTINTLAIRLDGEHWGELLDFYGGEEDLRQGIVRVLHSLSFVEDPTRILRAVRFEQRFGFRIEPRTEELIADARDLLVRVSGPRITHELELIFNEREPEKALARLHVLGVLPYIHPALTFNEKVAQRFRNLRRTLADRQPPAMRQHLYVALWVYDLRGEEIRGIIERLHLRREIARLLEDMVALRKHVSRFTADVLKPSQFVRLVHRRSEVALFVIAVAEDHPLLWERYDLYMRRWRQVRPTIDGTYLQKELGLRPGPAFGRILGRLRDAWLDGEIHTEEEERALLQDLLESDRVVT